MRRSRRGSTEVSLTTLLEAFVIFVLLVLVFIFAAKLYQVFFGPDKEALRAYELVADNINSALQRESDEAIEFRFTYKFKVTGGVLEGRDKYLGTIWAVGTDKKITTQFPAWKESSVPGTIVPDYNGLGLIPEQIGKECVGKPCLCFSKKTLKADAPVEEQKAVLTDPYKCRSFALPEGVTDVTFDFTQEVLEMSTETFPVVRIVKTTTGDALKLHLYLSVKGGTAAEAK